MKREPSNCEVARDSKGNSLRKLLGTIQVRLTIWNSLVVLVTVFLALFAAREGMKYSLELTTRELLREELIELELAIIQLYPDQQRIADEFERKVLSHKHNHWFARLIDADKRIAVWQSVNYPPEHKQIDKFAAEPFSFRRTEWLIISSHWVTTADGGKFIIVLGEPTTFIERDVWDLTKVMLMIGGAVLFIAPIGGYFLARNAMKPVRNIVNTTRDLEPSRLESRLPLRGTGDELDQISKEINSFVDEISRYLASQSEFIANAAHELRSPLTAIQTSVEVCLTKPRSNEEYCEQLETVSEQCQVLRHLVNQLLELAETKTAEMEEMADKDEFNFTELVNKSQSVFAGVADEKNVRVVSQLVPGLCFHGDSTKLMQVVNNLIDNAIKFTPPAGLIEIVLIQDESELYLTVQNSGPEFPQHSLVKIFDRFCQVDVSRQRNSLRGNGLGLSICKSVVELHRGKIYASQAPAGGLIVHVRLPV